MAIVGIAAYVPWLILVPILAFFFLKDADGFRRSAVSALPHRVRRRGYELFKELNATLAAYIRAQLLACLLVGTVCGVGFAVLGVPYAVLLGVLAGVLEFVPLVGPLVAAVVAGVLAALHAPLLALWVCAFLVVLRIVEDYAGVPAPHSPRRPPAPAGRDRRRAGRPRAGWRRRHLPGDSRRRHRVGHLPALARLASRRTDGARCTCTRSLTDPATPVPGRARRRPAAAGARTAQRHRLLRRGIAGRVVDALA